MAWCLSGGDEASWLHLNGWRPRRIPFLLWAAGRCWGAPPASQRRAGGASGCSGRPPATASSLPHERGQAGSAPAGRPPRQARPGRLSGPRGPVPGVGVGPSPGRTVQMSRICPPLRSPAGTAVAAPSQPSSFSMELGFGGISLEFPGSSPETPETARSRQVQLSGWGHFPRSPARAGACWPPAGHLLGPACCAGLAAISSRDERPGGAPGCPRTHVR